MQVTDGARAHLRVTEGFVLVMSEGSRLHPPPSCAQAWQILLSTSTKQGFLILQSGLTNRPKTDPKNWIQRWPNCSPTLISSTLAPSSYTEHVWAASNDLIGALEN
jgi:hypothetical protein